MRGLDPERAFPAEVLALRDAGVPLPTWYAGPLDTTTRDDVDRAMILLAEVRKAAS
jgi:hypothetical protein